MAKQQFSPDTSEKEKTIELAISSIEKQFGKGSIMRLGAETPIPQLSVISSGSLGLDIGLGVGGFPRGWIVEIFGPEASGKTTLALHAIAEAHKKGGIAAFVVVPLIKHSAMLKKPIRNLMPTIEVDGQAFVMAVPQLAAIAASELGSTIATVADKRTEIVAALDFLITGI